MRHIKFIRATVLMNLKKLLGAILIVMALAAPAKGHELSEKMLELFKDKNRNVSLGAMLIAAPVSDNEKLIEYVRWSLKKSDPAPDRLVKLYYLARTAMEKDEPLAFIKAFPEDPEKFNEVLAFDASLTRTVNGLMAIYLVELTECYVNAELREAARAKVERLRAVQMLSGWSAEIFPDEDFPRCPR